MRKLYTYGAVVGAALFIGLPVALAQALQTSTAPRPGAYATFANFARYAEANRALPPAGPDRVVFMGDSLTDTWGKQFDVSFPGKPYIGRGISGQTTPQMLLRFTQDVLDLKPAVVLLLAGTNDIAANEGPETDEQIEDNIKAMVMLAQTAHIRVVLSSLLPASKIPWRPSITDSTERIKRINAWLKQYAANHGLVYCDYYTAMVQPDGAMKPELAADGFVHPNAAGYAVMKPLAEAAIAQAFRMPVR